MDMAKVAKDYFISSQNTVLIPNRDFGRRKFIHVGVSRPSSSSNSKPAELQTDVIEMRAVNKQWVHPPEALLRGHIVYNVKFLGESEVDTPKGTDVVKESIRKRKFNKHIKKAEGQRTPRVELTISADGVTVQDPKTKMIMHQYPLHRISYCADDKTDRRMFTFIAKANETGQHYCYVFDSEKCAEEITLTIGQAFDLAYRRFLEGTGKDVDIKKQYLTLQKKVQALEQENATLKRRIQELEQLKDRAGVEQYLHKHQISDLTSVPVPVSPMENSTVLTLTTESFSFDESSTDELSLSPEGSEAQGAERQPTVGRRLENLIFEDPLVHTNGVENTHTNNTHSPPLLSPPPPSSRSRTHSQQHLLLQQQQAASPSQPIQSAPVQTAPGGFDPFGAATAGFGGGGPGEDPFGMGAFNPAGKSVQANDKDILKLDQELLDLQDGFSRGLSFGTEDFSLDDLDPLSHKL